MIDPNFAILKPVVVLIAWTLVMLVWLIATRLPAMRAAGVDLGKLIGGKGTDADGVLSARAQWKAHNHNHLLEQPTLFYAVTLVLVVIGQGGGVNATIAWAYVTLRILHSLVQALWNRVAVRFTLFMLATLALVALTLHAGMALFA
ncbi:MAG TPA: MAPEG family protein [Sphingomonas sp.]|nr:MAPEG family protein [Sphingomonas sp.]